MLAASGSARAQVPGGATDVSGSVSVRGSYTASVTAAAGNTLPPNGNYQADVAFVSTSTITSLDPSTQSGTFTSSGSYTAQISASGVPNFDADLRSDERVLAFMRERVKVVPVWGQAMFSPSIVIRTRAGASVGGTYPYARMEWDFAQLEERLQDCLPGYPGGKPAFDRLVQAVRGTDTWTSMAAVHEVIAG